MRFDIHPFKDIEAAREYARSMIDQSAGTARARYITVTQGQDATYQAKYAEAQAFARAGYPEADIDLYPWVREEASATNVAPREAADSIKASGDPWNMVLGPKIEGLRIGGKNGLPGLTTISAVLAHMGQVMAQLDSV